jgi:hypothetical protein
MSASAAGVFRRGTDALASVAQGDTAWGHFTRRHAIALLFMREHVPALRDLERGPWAILQAIAAHWQGSRIDAFPGQERLSMLCGYDARSVRNFPKRLQACKVLKVLRVKLPDGTARLHYEPGPSLLAAVDQFHSRYSDARAPTKEAASKGGEVRRMRAKPLAMEDGLRRGCRRIADCPEARDSALLPEPPATISGGGAATVSGELPDLRDQKNTSFCLSDGPEGLASSEVPKLDASELDRDIAREALGTLRERRFGRRVKLFESNVVAMVTACVSAIAGDRETKLRAQLDAIEHAFRKSRGAPTPSYIWGNIDHFLEHEAGGRSARVEGEQARVRKQNVAEAERSRAREWARREREACPPPPEVLQFIEDFGRGRDISWWRRA